MATDFLKLTQEAYDASTSYIDTNFRADWEYSLRAFRNEHASGSKYLSEDFKARSRLFRPKTRSIIRKNEAAGMQAAFSNREMVNVQPENPDNLMSIASAAALKAVLEYRLSRTLPTYEIYLGGLQDAQVQGSVISYQYWEYENRNGKKIKDQPCIELRPVENIRLDAGASWLNPVSTSPYFCDIIPMYVCDVKGMMNNKDPKTGSPQWKSFDDATIAKARPDLMDTTRKARIGNQQDPVDETSGIKSFDIVWVMRWFMKNSQAEDYCYYSLGTEELLTDPKPRDEIYFHDIRPYVIGYSVLETHKVMKTSMPVLTKPLQQETNDVANQRLDNVKFVLNKRWLVARGRQVDVQSLVRNVPGGVTLTTDPKTDIIESNWQDVTSSAYVEQDRINSDFDELAGNFSPSTKVANNAVNDTLGGSRMASASAGLMSDYLIRTVNETWWEKVLRQLALLEQYYETDEIVLTTCANKAKLFPRFGISKITDDLLMSEAFITVDMAMGDPNQRLQKFLFATQAVYQSILQAPPGANVGEIIKEIYSNAGYRDGERFFSSQQDPRLVKAMQMVEQLHQQLQGKQMDLQAQAQIEQQKLLSNERIQAASLFIDKGRIDGDLAIRQSEIAVSQQELNIEQQKVEIERLKLTIDTHSKDIENVLKHGGMTSELKLKQAQLALEQQKLELEKLQLTIDAHAKDIENSMKVRELESQDAASQSEKEIAVLKIENERQKLHGQILKLAQELEKGQQEIEKASLEKDSVITNDAVQNVTNSLSAVSEEIQKIRQQVEEGSKAQMQGMMQGMTVLAKAVSTKKKPKGLTLRKGKDNRTQSIEVKYDDGSTEEMPVKR
jgi:hypothetical protein